MGLTQVRAVPSSTCLPGKLTGSPGVQVQYKVFEQTQLKPLLDVANEQHQKEKDQEAGS